MIEIGNLKDGTKVNVADSSPNWHMVLFGISGAGKTSRLNHILPRLIENGGTVIEFDMNGKDDKTGVMNVNRISAVNDGLNFHFLDTDSVETGKESYSNFVSYMVDILSKPWKLGVRQEGALREAIEFAIEHKDEYASEWEAIGAGLELQSTSVARGVYNKFWSIMKGGIFRENPKKLQDGCINSICLEGINPSTQTEVLEIILSMIWRNLRLHKRSQKNFFVVIDEFQNLSFGKKSVLMEMLCEGRGYSLNLILATQSVSIISQKVLKTVATQTSTQIYFQQNGPDVRRVAELIEAGNAERWMLKLKKLNVGQAIVTGALNIRGNEIKTPIIVSPIQEEQKSNSLRRL